MKYKFETEDDKEAIRIIKSTDMALALYDISRGMLKSLDHREDMGKITVDDVRRHVFETLEKYAIDIDELIE